MTIYHLRPGVEVVNIAATASPDPIPEIPANVQYTVVNVTTTSTEHRIMLPADADIGTVVEIYQETAYVTTVYPPSGGTINDGATDATMNLGDAFVHYFRKVGASAWRTIA